MLKKPSLVRFSYVMNDIGCQAEECIFIDDLSANIRAAEEIGMHGILFVSVQNLKDELKKYMPI